jgi:hypothetical protein
LLNLLQLKEIETNLRPILGDELTDWLKKETAENRNHAKSKGKKYWEWLDEKGNAVPHDARGATSFVAGPYYKLPVRDIFCASLRYKEGKINEFNANEGT